MLQFMRPKGVLQLKNSVNLLNHSTLARTVQSTNFDHCAHQLPVSCEQTSAQCNRHAHLDLNQIQRFEHNQPAKKSNSQVNAAFKGGYTPSDLWGPEDTSKPSREQLDEFHRYLEDNFRKFFVERVNLAYFDPKVIIDDNQTGVPKRETGLAYLVQKISYIKIYYSLMYSFNVMSVLSIAKLHQEGMIKLRWRITSKGRMFIFLQFWRVRELKRKEHCNDGIVYFYLNNQGKVRHIVLEKIEKDKDEKLIEVPVPLRKVLKSTS